MILVDTSVWIDHLAKGDATLKMLLNNGRVLSHPFVIGELAMGNLKQRDAVIGGMKSLPAAELAENEEVMRFVTQHTLFGLGIGYIDAHLVTSAQLTPDARLWTRDKRLLKVAEALDLAFVEVQ